MVQVDLVQGDWLWVGSRQAYLEKQDAVPIAAAEAHYTQIIESKKETSSYFRRAKFYRSAGSFDKALLMLPKLYVSNRGIWS